MSRVLAKAVSCLWLVVVTLSPCQAQVLERTPLGERLFINVVLERQDNGALYETWVGTNRGAFFLDLELRPVAVKPGAGETGAVHGIAELAGRLFFATDSGLWVESSGELELAPLASPADRINEALSSIYVTEHGLWLGRRTGGLLYVSSKGRRHPLDIAGKVSSVRLDSASSSSQPLLWVTSHRELLLLRLTLDEEGGPARVDTLYTREGDFEEVLLAPNRRWAVERYSLQDSPPAYRRVFALEGGVKQLELQEVADRVVALDLVRDRELWVARDFRLGDTRVEVSRMAGSAGIWSELEPTDLPSDELGYPNRFFVDSTRPDSLWIWSTAGLIRGRPDHGGDWTPFDTCRDGPPQNVIPGSRGTVLVACKEELIRLHPETIIDFELGFEWIGRVTLPRFPSSSPRRYFVISPRLELRAVDCSYQGPTHPHLWPGLKGCEQFAGAVLSGTRSSRASTLRKWRSQPVDTRSESAPSTGTAGSLEPGLTSLPFEYTSGYLRRVFGGVRDRHGNEVSIVFDVFYPGWKAVLVIVLASMLLSIRFGGFAFAALEIVLGTRVTAVTLRVPILRSLYLRRYCYRAEERLERMSPRAPTRVDEDFPRDLVSALADSRFCVVAAGEEEATLLPLVLERWFLSARYGGTRLPASVRRLFASMRRHGAVSGLLPVRVDLGVDGDSIPELELSIIKRLKSLGGFERRIAEFIWQHADSLLIVSSSRRWQDAELISLLRKLVRHQGQDLEARTVVIARAPEAESLRTELSALGVGDGCILKTGVAGSDEGRVTEEGTARARGG